MLLNYKLPENIKLKFAAEGLPAGDIVYSAPVDLDLAGNIAKNSFFAATAARLCFLPETGSATTFEFSALDEIKCEPAVNCGLIILAMNNQKAQTENDSRHSTLNSQSSVFDSQPSQKSSLQLLARVSMKHITRFSYIARGVNLLIAGDPSPVYSPERETTCPNCGRALPGTNRCPRCSGRMHSLSRIITLAAPYKFRFLLIFLTMSAVSLFQIFLQWVQKNFINRHIVTGSGTVSDVAWFLAAFAGCTAVVIAGTVLKNLLSVRLGSKISRDLRAALFTKIQLLSMRFINGRQTGELMNRVVHDTGEIRGFMENAFSGMFTVIITMSTALTAMLIMDPLLTLATVIFMPVALMITRVFQRRTKRMNHLQRRRDDRLNNRLQDVLMGIRVVKAFGTEEREAEMFDRQNAGLTEATVRNELFWATLFPFLTFIMGIGLYIAMFFGGKNVLNGRFMAGDLTQFLAYAGMLYGPLGWIAHLPRAIMRLLTAIERTSDILDEETELSAPKEPKLPEFGGEIAFHNVSFGYVPYLPVLKNVSFTAKPGEMIGIVGASGSGKSTIINLLMRLYDVGSGSITLNGKDLRELDANAYHRQLGVVLQETYLFYGTVQNNIRYSKPDATFEEVIEAAKTANAHDFITALPDGYNTLIGEGKNHLSGGERQRIAIARAVLNNPGILILDEATSSLDTDSETKVQEALARLTAGRTTFAIAHRLSTLRNAARLIVLDNMTVAEVGTHAQLIKQRGIYYGLVTAQLQLHRASAE